MSIRCENGDQYLVGRYLLILDTSKNMLPILNITIFLNLLIKYN